jgi:hypothetical protein
LVDLAAIAAEFIDDGDVGPLTIGLTAPLWRWQSEKSAENTNAWFFLTITGDVREAIAAAARAKRGGFGSVKVEARVGGTVWRTSVFPSKDPPGYFLPMKASVRKAEKLAEGDAVTVELTLNPATGR